MAEIPTRLSVIANLPPAVREETWRRAHTAGGQTRVTDAMVSVLPGEVVLVTTEVVHDLLSMCGFARIDHLPETADDTLEVSRTP